MITRILRHLAAIARYFSQELVEKSSSVTITSVIWYVGLDSHHLSFFLGCFKLVEWF